MKRTTNDFCAGFAFALLLTAAAGCNQQKTVVEPPQFKDVANNLPFKNNNAKLNQVAQNLPANRQADILAQQMRRSPVAPPVNPALNIQRSLQTVEEINRINRLNQQLRQNQPQKR